MADESLNSRTSGKTGGRELGGPASGDPMNRLSASNRQGKWATIQDVKTARTADTVQIPRPYAIGTGPDRAEIIRPDTTSTDKQRTPVNPKSTPYRPAHHGATARTL